MKPQTIQKYVEKLNNQEFTEFLNWVISDERERRKTVDAETKAQVEQVQGLRDNGILKTPTPKSKYEVGTVYLPHETVVLDDVIYEVASPYPVSTSPAESDDWVEVVTE